MEQKKYILAIAGILLILSTCFFYKDTLKQMKSPIQNITKDEKKFKEEYEYLNGKQREGRDYKNKTIHILDNNRMVYAKKKEILDLLEDGTGIIYFGFPDCPWCRNAVPVLIDAANGENVEKIYYYNALSERDEKILQDGQIKTVKEGSSFYYTLLEKLGAKASVYEDLKDDHVKRLYFPTIVFIKEGEILSIHEGTVETQKDPLRSLSKEEEKKLRDKYTKSIQEIYSSVCDDKC